MDKDYVLRFPIGESPFPAEFDPSEVQKNISAIAALPKQLIEIVKSASQTNLKNPYRDGGLTGLQVLHHIADSHINAFCRFKLALTESNPTIKPYQEQDWANLADYDEKMIEPTLALLQALHCKWVHLLESLSENQWRRTFFHPGNNQVTAIFQHATIYAWHGKHHLEHIKIAINIE